MKYSFPDVQKKCLSCGEVNCARWKGYFHRLWFCGEKDKNDVIAIHVFHCRTNKTDCSYIPDFLIPGRRLSRASMQRFLCHYRKTKSVKGSIDELYSCFEKNDFFLPLSTAYNFIYSFVKALSLNFQILDIQPPSVTSVFSIQKTTEETIVRFFRSLNCVWVATHDIIFQPP